MTNDYLKAKNHELRCNLVQLVNNTTESPRNTQQESNSTVNNEAELRIEDYNRLDNTNYREKTTE